MQVTKLKKKKAKKKKKKKSNKKKPTTNSHFQFIKFLKQVEHIHSNCTYTFQTGSPFNNAVVYTST